MRQEIEKQKEYIKKVAEENKGKNLKYCILTMGCQLNEWQNKWDIQKQKILKMQI